MELTPCKFCQAQIEYEPIVGMPFTLRPSVCVTCEGIRRSEAAEALRRSRYEAWQRICPPIYQDTDPNHPSMPRSDRLAVILNWKYGPTGLIVRGVTRLGKTRSLWMLLKRLMVEEGRTVAALTDNQFASHCSAAYSVSSEVSELWKDELATADVLFLDDLGKCKLTDRVEADLFDLIETRTSNKRPIFITTNYDGKTLLTRLSPDRGAPMIARLREFSTTLTL